MLIKNLPLVCYCISILYDSIDAQEVRVKIPTGNYRGQVSTNYNGEKFLSFTSIKYATVVERFKEGVPAEDSNQVFDATKSAPLCVQPLTDAGKGMAGIEDCLYLNVYTPNLNGSLPVMFYIYGGAFVFGSSKSILPGYFMETKRVVIVTVGYRLSTFGFLYFGDPDYPANLGIRDQILGLKWVKKYIKSFGGDPTRVTIVGESAGGGSVSLLTHSPLAKGLFIGAISESGAVCSGWDLQPACTGLQRLSALVGQTSCSLYLPGKVWTGDTKALVKCLQKLTAEQLIKAMANMPLLYKVVPFPPIVEPTSVSRPVINTFPWLQPNVTDRVPWLSGVNSNEGYNLVLDNINLQGIMKIKYQVLTGYLLPDVLGYRFLATSPFLTTVFLQIYYLYLYLINYPQFLIELVGQRFMYYSLSQCSRSYPAPVYNYFFGYIQEDERVTDKVGVGHTGELKFIWPSKYSVRLNGSQSDINMSNNLVNAWVDFAYNQKVSKFGNTTWERLDPKKDNVLIIGNSRATMGVNPKRKDNALWSTLGLDQSPRTTNCNSLF